MKKRYSNFFEKLICMGAVILAVIPLLFVAGKSVQVPEEYLILLFKRPLYLRMMWNSLIITIPVLIGQLLLAPLAAYGFWQCRWKYKEILFYLYMIVMLMPLQLTLVPNYLVANWLGIQNSSLAIILPAIGSPFLIFFFKQNAYSFPKDTLEAARMDGLNEYQIFFKIFMPMMKSTYAAAGIFMFMASWNNYMWPLIALQSDTKFTLPLVVANLASGFTPDYGMTMVGIVLSTLPTIIVFFTLQKSFVEGMSGSVK